MFELKENIVVVPIPIVVFSETEEDVKLVNPTDWVPTPKKVSLNVCSINFIS